MTVKNKITHYKFKNMRTVAVFDEIVYIPNDVTLKQVDAFINRCINEITKKLLNRKVLI